MKNTKEYFIEKFESIPAENWTKGELTHPIFPDCHCALGHCGVRTTRILTEEAKALAKLLKPNTINIDTAFVVFSINDAGGGGGEEAKENILNALKAL